VSAIDRDIGTNGQVVYTLVEDGDGRFSIDEITGQIKVNRKLAFHDQNHEYKLIVEASDKGRTRVITSSYISFIVKTKCY